MENSRKKVYKIPDYIRYKKNILYIHSYSSNELVKKYGTPCVCVSLDRVKKNLADLQRILKSEYPNYKIFYALKASYFKPVLKSILSLKNIGIEVLSDLEIEITEHGGVKSEDLVFNGVGRKGESIYRALKKGSIVNIDSINELEGLIKQNCANIDFSVGLRVHPEFAGDGNFVLKESKLGLTYKDAAKCVRLALSSGIKINGVSFHIFSNLIESKEHSLAVESIVAFMNDISNKFSVRFDYLDIGGGLNSPMFMDGDFLEKIIRGTAQALNKYQFGSLALYLELGRYIVADATAILSRVNMIKKKNGEKWAILDIGTNYLIPAPGFNFKVISLKNNSNKVKYSFVDGICSPAGFIDGGYISKLHDGDGAAILNAGAYTSVMKEEFVYPSPVHIFFNEGKIIKKYTKKDVTEVLKYHNWEK